MAGREISVGGSCTGAQRTKAHDAVASYLRENSPTASHEGGGNVDIRIQGRGTIYGGAALNGSIFGHKEGAYALMVSGDGLTCTGLFRHAPGEVGSESTSVNGVDGAHGTAVLVRIAAEMAAR